MASQLKVDEITTVSGTGTLKIAGNVQVNAADNTSGIVLPNGTEAQRATAPVLGETRVNNENKTIEFYNGTTWIPTRSPLTWWEVNASGSSDYTIAGPGFATATADPLLYVMRGFTYAFDNTIQASAHPFRIQSSQGLSGTPYTDGQTGSGTAVLYWTVPMDSPNTLYYQCTLHSLMNGTINVLN